MRNGLRGVLRKMDELENSSCAQGRLRERDARAVLIVSLVFLVCMLSLPLSALSQLMLFFIFPILTSGLAGLDYGSVFRHSLVVLPFVALVGIFNPIYDRRIAFTVGSIAVTGGWVSFASIVLRGLLSVQAVIVLVRSVGYYRLCRAMGRLGVPAVLITQLLFVYRYSYVLVQQALFMTQARDARGFGRRSYPLKVYGAMVGQLLVRTMHRAQQIHGAMLARGFDGRIPAPPCEKWKWSGRDTVYTVLWCAALIAGRVWRAESLFALIQKI